MHTAGTPITGYLLALAPALLLLVGLLPSRLANRSPRVMGWLVQAAAVTGLLGALGAIASFAAGDRAAVRFAAVDLPAGIGQLALAVQVDRVTLAVLTLVTLLVSLVARFSVNYLDGDRDQGRFFRLLALTAGLFTSVVVAGNLLMFALAITLTGLALNQLLTFYPGRPKAVMAAHKKMLMTRLADVSMLAAVVCVGSALGTLSFDGIATGVAELDGELPWTLHLAAWLVVAATIFKSAQFPFHGWLLQVMEAPTQVSALLHAGIVYSGALLVLRTPELLLADGVALVALALFGLTTAVLGSLAMLTQTAIKSSLAWSTAAQLGFMLLELGLGLFTLALLHLMAHSLYKAHAFLASGSIVDVLRSPGVPVQRRLAARHWLLVVVAGGVASFGIGALLGITVAHEPALIALGTIVAVAIAQPVLQGLALQGSGAILARVVPISALVATVYFGFHHLFTLVFAADLGGIPAQASVAEYLFLALVALVFVGLSFVQAVVIPGGSSPRVRRLFVHLYNGLYVDHWMERLVYHLWPHRVGPRSGRSRGPMSRGA